MKQLLHSQRLQAKYYNRRHLDQQFNEGQMVLLSAKNIQMKRPHKKLDSKFLGPFKVLKRIGKQAYKLDLPDSMSRLHPTFHVSLLERYHGRPDVQPPPVELMDNGEHWEVEKIVDYQERAGQPQYKVKWLGWSHEHDSWMFESDLYNCQEVLEEYKARVGAAQSSHAKRRRRAATTTAEGLEPTPKRRGHPKKAVDAPAVSDPAPKRGRGRPKAKSTRK
jgi:hypothetical protein